jgi:hypothetical protein
MDDETRDHALALAREVARRASLLPPDRREAYLQDLSHNMSQTAVAGGSPRQLALEMSEEFMQVVRDIIRLLSLSRSGESGNR